jgi:hypothetical protein
MKTLKLISALALALAFTSCDSDSVPESVAGPTNNFNGRVIHVQGRLDVSQARGSNAVVVFRKHSVIPDANGLYEINDTLAGNASSARVLESGVNDTVRIVIGKDTLREIPVNSWSNILPTNYIVQRNISAVVDAKYAGKTVEALWWNADSIAHVVTLGQGTTATNYSGYIYNVYDDSAYGVNAHLYFLLARIRSGASSNDSVLAYTDVMDVKAKAGDLSYSVDQFMTDFVFFRLGYPRTPVDSSLALFGAKTTYMADTLLLTNAVAQALGDKAQELYAGTVQINDSKNELLNKFKWTKVVMIAQYQMLTIADTVTYTTFEYEGGRITKDTLSVIRPAGSTSFVHVFDIEPAQSLSLALNATDLQKQDSTITVKSYLVK